MKITKMVSDLLESNTFVVEKEGYVVIIDCGCKLSDVKKLVGDKKVVGILLTHGHYDHALYCNDYAKEFGCSVYANENIKKTLTDAKAFYSEDGSIISDFSRFNFIKEDCKLKLGDFEIKCYAFPGHSPCCEGYIIENNLFAGDFLFAKSFGRVDFVNSKKDDMLKSFDKIAGIEFEKVYSGHGEESTRAEQLSHLNVFKKFLKR